MATLDMTAPSDRRQALRRMLLIREFERAVRDNFADGEIPGFVHLYLGQEAVAVGACAALTDDDYVTSTHRGHGHCLAKGMDERRLMAELYGRSEGYCRGKGGSMHAADLDEGMLGAQPIVGAGVPLATGAGLTAQLHDRDWVGLSFFGDGAVAEGQVHESINLAATWDLPAIYVIENNLYSEGMTFEKQHNVDDLADSAAAYGIPGVVVDGMDVEAVYEAVTEARERAARGDGPTLIEAKTYRYRGHYEGDPEPYRTQAEVDEWRENRDAIDTFAARLREEDIIDEGDREEMEAAVKADIEAAIEYARDAPFPDPEEAYDDVFVEPNPDVEYFRERRDGAGSTGGAGR
ncbi:thiamine pyrophosphate-dependent dehydrogenase E1 component subunit alpha [Haloplanus pelagicus]|uniref:thiamine pyrophosphate-dependent dehydrogenase E1 component subunit alpha n=1 Tax=Haloplanus pelagicus TaxID=2949995 RepID=UPI00203EB8E9|nr:thiamine pyrophosphate-dependent dehydrogenase E1 component subunit alpha [Haloplanus sp. HW8-1]